MTVGECLACGAGGSIKPGVERSATPGSIANNDHLARGASGSLVRPHVRFIHKLSEVLRDLKANASGLMHDVFPEQRDFPWQRGYGAFTVSQSSVEEVRRYIARQKEHHQKVSFRDEFIHFLKANEIEYDERYL
jgi:hypothetical protein